MRFARWPMIAIIDAKRKARAWGYQVFDREMDPKLPIHFIIHDRGCISIVWVRRIKHAAYRREDIEISCAAAIRETRQMDLSDGIYRELWVWGPDRTWYRYLVLKNSIEYLENGDG